MEIDTCPILKPTWKQFKNFYEFVQKADKLYKPKYGMVKVVPPPEWKPRYTKVTKELEDLVVKGPIQQNISGKGGVYECLHIQKKSLTLKQYKDKMGSFDKITQGLSPEEVEKMFWKNIVFSPPLYGADLLNTLMEDSAGPWNLNCLKSLLQYSLDSKIKGVNTPYCYIGSWKTLFCWHKEDLDLSAINYIHEGKSKFWYSIPASQHQILEKQAKKLFPQHFSKCGEHLRHKTTLINPYMLKKNHPQLLITKTQHKQNEFILVFGGAYHCGFNFGFNIAEAVNYGTLSWLEQLLDSKPCTCSKSSVRASHIEVYKNLEKSPIATTKQFINFKQKIYELVQKEDEQQQKTNEIKAVKSQYSRKIRKQKKKVSTLNYKGDVYNIENWAQCEKCNQWRKILTDFDKQDHFQCNDIHKKCHVKQKTWDNYIAL